MYKLDHSIYRINQMSVTALRIITAIGLASAIIALIGFLIYGEDSNNHLILEIISVGVFGFVCGYQKYARLIWFTAVGTTLAIILDTAIWNLFGLPKPFDMQIFSLGLNAALFVVFLIFYAGGSIFINKSG